jgi:hypothetical protein
MLNTTIELWPHGDVGSKRALAYVAIWNDGSGDDEFGNYGYAITTEHDPRWGAPGGVPWPPEWVDMIRRYEFADDTIDRQGTIKRFRRRDGSVKLLAVVLQDAYGEYTKDHLFGVAE